MSAVLNHYKKTLVLVVILLASCTIAKDADLQAEVDAMSACEKVDGLIGAYANDFEGIKGREVTNPYMGIWYAKVDAVGESCQVWHSADTKTTYVCTQNTANEEVARELYREAISRISPCLTDWQLEERPRKDDPGSVANWTKPGKFPSISAHVFPVRGKHWMLYFFVGDHDDRF